MAPILRFRKLSYSEPTLGFESFETPKTEDEKPVKTPKTVRIRSRSNDWGCIDYSCWIIGCLCTSLWILLFLYHCLPDDLPGLKLPELPGERLKRDGLTALHPVVMVPGFVTGGLELWEGKPCAGPLFRKRLWGGNCFTEMLKRPSCWLEHLALDNETGLDPPGIRVRSVPGLVAADYFTAGYFVWAVLIENLARIGYEDKNMYMAAYDWRLSYQNTEVRDQSLTRLKNQIELMYTINGNKKVVVVPHSMGVLYFLHFTKWVELPPPVGGGGGPDWCAKHIKSIMNIGPTFLGVPKAVSSILSSAFMRSVAPGLFDSDVLRLQTLEHAMWVSRTWDSTIGLLPKGGNTIWGDLDSSPEEGQNRNSGKKNNSDSSGKTVFKVKKEPLNFGRVVSFGREAAELPSSQLPILTSEEFMRDSVVHKSSCEQVWTEYDEMSRESIKKVAENKSYTTDTVMDLLRFVAPKMMNRAESQFSHGLAENLDDPKYDHYKYWSNPLETKLPNAPDIEIYCLYGVGVPTERSYIYKLSPSDRCRTIPYRIDTSVDGEVTSDGFLKGGVYYTDGDSCAPVLSAGFMCARGWKGKTRFNPSGSATYIREYNHKAPASFLEGRGAESGAHVDIMGNVAMIEDVLRVAAGATGAEIGGDRIYSDILKISERVNIQL